MDSLDTAPLTGHCTMLIDGECYTFPLPVFHDTVVRGWGYGSPGEFEQQAWSADRVARWHRQQDWHEWTQRRFGWVRRITIPVPIRFQDYDEDGYPAGHFWGRTTLGEILAGRLIFPAPLDRGSHLVTHNAMESVALLHTHGVVFADNSVLGSHPGMPGLHIEL